MKAKLFTESEKVPFNLEAFKLFTDEKNELVYLKLAPGEALAVHKNPFDVIFFIIQGTGTLLCNNNEFVFSKNTTIEILKEEDRAWTNNSNEELILLVIKRF